MHRLRLPAQWLLGLLYLIYGLNGFFLFTPIPPLEPKGAAFMQALMDTGYMLYFWKGIEVITAVCFLTNRWVPAAAVVAMPVSVNILAFHLFLDRPSLVAGLVVFGLNTWILAAYRHCLGSLFNHQPLREKPQNAPNTMPQAKVHGEAMLQPEALSCAKD